MAELPPQPNQTVTTIYESYAVRKRDIRYQLGASDIGEECDRKLWYRFRWAATKEYTGRQLRLFETGHIEEKHLIDNLREIGCTVNTGIGKNQHEAIDCNGHFAVHADGIIEKGVPESPKKTHLLECKTMSSKYFKGLQTKGLKEAFPEYYDQVVMGIEKFKLARGLFLAVCKDTDELYSERVYPDSMRVIYLLRRASGIIFANRIPPRQWDDPTYYKCKWCEFNHLCHAAPSEFPLPDVNCRTCCHSTPIDGGKWRCEKLDRILGKTQQQTGCSIQLFHPDLINGEAIDSKDRAQVTYRLGTGETITNLQGGKWVRV